MRSFRRSESFRCWKQRGSSKQQTRSRVSYSRSWTCWRSESQRTRWTSLRPSRVNYSRSWMWRRSGSQHTRWKLRRRAPLWLSSGLRYGRNMASSCCDCLPPRNSRCAQNCRNCRFARQRRYTRGSLLRNHDSRLNCRCCRNVPRNTSDWANCNSDWNCRRSHRDSRRRNCRCCVGRYSVHRLLRRSCHHRGNHRRHRLRRGTHHHHRLRRDHHLRAARMLTARTEVLRMRLRSKET